MPYFCRYICYTCIKFIIQTSFALGRGIIEFSARVVYSSSYSSLVTYIDYIYYISNRFSGTFAQSSIIVKAFGPKHTFLGIISRSVGCVRCLALAVNEIHFGNVGKLRKARKYNVKKRNQVTNVFFAAFGQSTQNSIKI